MARRLLTALFVGFAALGFVTVAAAADKRVALVDPDPNLLDAITVALSPWSLHVVRVSASIPSSDAPMATAAVQLLARAREAAAVVWIEAPAGELASLRLYDAQTGQTSVRSLFRAPPFDEAAAASVALTVKTLLRSTTVAPPSERTETQPTPSAPGPAPPAATRPLTTAPNAAVAPANPPAAAPTSTSSNRPRVRGWHVDALVFGHLGTNATVVPSAGLSLIFWPHTWNGRVGVGIEGRAGLDLYTKGALSSRTDVSAALSESVAAVSARARFGDGRLFLELAAGPSLHILGLSYSVVSAGSPMAGTVTRVDPAFEVAAFPEVSIGDRVRVGALIGSSLLPVHQRFIAAGETVLRIDAAAYDFGGRVSFVLD